MRRLTRRPGRGPLGRRDARCARPGRSVSAVPAVRRRPADRTADRPVRSRGRVLVRRRHVDLRRVASAVCRPAPTV
ncbi:putative leader peptide [Streptomyces daliensis]